MRTGSILLLAACLAFALSVVECQEANKRCKYFQWVRACKLSCKVLGHTTGACDSKDVCHCSEEDYDFFADVSEWFESLDVTEVVTKMVNKFKTKVKELKVSENIKELVPSKCKVGQEFCSAACHSIGRVSGKCNSDFSDCDCSDEKVTLKQYALCAEESICRLDCQRQGMSTGVCKGTEDWDCVCITKNDVEVVNTVDVERESTTSSLLGPEEIGSAPKSDEEKVSFDA